MRFALLFSLLFSTLPTAAQIDAGDLLKRGLTNAWVGSTRVSAAEQKEVLEALSKRLKTSIAVKTDGSATSNFKIGDSASPYKVEWKGFTVRAIRRQSVTEADQLNGITQRYFVMLGATASRYWDRGANDWTKWKNGGHVHFPSGVFIERLNGKLQVKESTQLGWYSSPSPPRTTVRKPAGPREQGLPPGVTRMR